MSRGGLSLVVVLILAGCSGGGDQENLSTVADATRIANVRPVTLDWAWPESPEEPAPSSEASTDSDTTDPLVAKLRSETAHLFDLGEAGNRWQDDNKVGNLAVGVYASTSDARQGMAALNAFSRGFSERNGTIVKEDSIDGLGDEAWLLVGGSGSQVTYHWRRGNLVIEAHLDCFGHCPGDIEAATRAWVDAIDQAARSQ